MSFIKNILIITFSSFFLFYFKLFSVVKVGFIYRKFYRISFIKDNFLSNMQTRNLFEILFFLGIILIFFLIFKLLSNYLKLDKSILLIIVVSPIIFETSTILYDKSCFKPWENIDVFIWYFPMRLALWIFLYLFFKDLMPMLKVKKNLLIIICVFLVFHFLKINSTYNF